MYRHQYEDAAFTVPYLDMVRTQYQKAKNAAARAQEAVRQLGLEPIIRMADEVTVVEYGPNLTIELTDVAHRWSIPVIDELDLPWEMHWTVDSFRLWEWDKFYPHEPRLVQRHQETMCHVLTLDQDKLRELKVNGRKKRPLHTLTIKIHHEFPGWGSNNEITLPDGCVCRKEFEYDTYDTVVSCRMRS